MADSTYWWLAAGALVAVELVSGTFYLLMVSSGLVAAALGAHLGLAPPWQWACAALVGGASVLIWRRYRLTRAAKQQDSEIERVQLDIGETVHVSQWRDDGSCSVKYRGAQWEAALRAGDTANPGVFSIVEVVGSRLILTQSPSP